VILVTWNVHDLVLKCIEQLLERADELELEIILVDNGSSDGTVLAVQEQFPVVRVIPNHENLGFPRANNLALCQARGRHILFLNPDTEVGPGTLTACVQELDRDSTIGAVGCRVILPDGQTQVECARHHYRLLDLLWEGFYLHVLFPRNRIFAHQVMGDWDHSGRRDVEAILGAFIMARREAVLQVGGMPDDLFMYHEDLAFCLRLQKCGWRVHYLGDVSTLHQRGASTAQSSSPLELLEGEVRVRLVKERSGFLAGLLARILFGVRSSVRLLISVVTRPIPALRRRFPQVTNISKHATLMLWTVYPGVVDRSLRRSGIPLDERPHLLLVAPTPPPVHGVSVYTRMLLSSIELRTQFRIHHVELADRRSLENMGRLDIRNILLAFRHSIEVLIIAQTRRPALCYISLSQNSLAFLRDAFLIAAARSGGARVVAHLHGGFFGEFYRTAPSLLRWAIRLTHGWIHRCWVLGEDLQPLFKDLLPPTRIRVVPNGIPDHESDIQARVRADGKPLTVLFMGQVCEAKGVIDLLDALTLCKASGHLIRCIVAGAYLTAHERDMIEPRILDLEKQGLVVRLGVVEGHEKARAFAEADAFVLPSKYPLEGQPLAILEAMAAGTPVISTPRAAIPDMVVDGVTGFLVPEGDVSAIAAALCLISEDDKLANRLGQAGRKLYLANFTQEKCISKVSEEFHHALS